MTEQEAQAEALKRYDATNEYGRRQFFGFTEGVKWERSRNSPRVIEAGWLARPVLSADNREALIEVIAKRLSWPSIHWDWRSSAAHEAIADAILSQFALPVTPEPTEALAKVWDEGRAFGELRWEDQRPCLCRNPEHHERNPYRVPVSPTEKSK